MRTTDGYGLAQVSGSGQQDFNQSSRRCCDSDYRSVEPCQARRSHRLKLLAFLRSPSATRQSSLEALPEIRTRPLRRLTALRPYLAIGLPLSYAIIALQKINVVFDC